MWIICVFLINLSILAVKSREALDRRCKVMTTKHDNGLMSPTSDTDEHENELDIDVDNESDQTNNGGKSMPFFEQFIDQADRIVCSLKI